MWAVFPGTLPEFIRQCYRPLQLAWFPAIFWSGLEYGTSVSWISVLGTTTAVILSPPTYNFGNDALGLIWLSPLVHYSALFRRTSNDQLMMFLSRRNRCWREPEFRLWSFLPTGLIMPAGLILYSVGAANGLLWIGPIIGMGLAIDGEAVTTVILIRIIIGSTLTFGIQPWIDSLGVQNTFIMAGCLAFAITMASGLLIVWGKQMRHMTRGAYSDSAGGFKQLSRRA